MQLCNGPWGGPILHREPMVGRASRTADDASQQQPAPSLTANGSAERQPNVTTISSVVFVSMTPPQRITAADILRAAGTLDDESEEPVSGSALLVQAAGSILAKAENAFLASLSRISVEDLARSTTPKLRKATK